ncbi:MAG TPA: 3-hydroxyacyl-CoA dehydrogenase NAD-binding domain-containing protein [Kofleriaceae bacterium]|nr:3-hydroxyacyl-CoA dehydrogenase NAD-binding domain-containing protein [Kofleriaceae bacterium]
MTHGRAPDLDVRSLGIVGAGLMGTGIAEVAAASGFRTVLIKVTGGDPAAPLERISRALARLTVTGDRDALVAADLVVESIIEDLGEKRAVFSDLVQRTGERAVLATNTSTLRLRDLAAPSYRDRLVGMHFFSPVQAMGLVELAHLPDTRPEVVRACQDVIGRMGKTAVPVVDSAGFVVNRLLVPYLVGAVAAYAQGLAGAVEIDTAMKLGCNHPVGPLSLCDLIGLDVVLAMSKLLYREFADDRFRPPPLLRRMVHDGQLGRKTGLGFYDYSQSPPVPNKALYPLIHGELDELHGDVGHAA